MYLLATLLLAPLQLKADDEIVNDKWTQLYKKNLQDIVLIESVRQRDLSLELRTFELYSEQLFLIMERENEFELKQLDDSKYTTRLKQLSKLRVKTFKKMSRLAPRLLRSTNSPETKARILYIMGLQSLNNKKEKEFENYFLQANKLAKEIRLIRDIKVKLAEYYFNEKKYRKSLSLYLEILKLPKNKWFIKHKFNAAWSALKLNKNKLALNLIIQSYIEKNSKLYASLGDQHLEAVLLFHAINNKSNQALRFLIKNNLNNFKNTYNLLVFTIENGKREDAPVLFKELDGKKSTPTQLLDYLVTKAKFLRTNRNFPSLQKLIYSLPTHIKKKQIDIDDSEKITQEIKNYTGFLQETLKRKDYLNPRQSIVFTNYVINNFTILSKFYPDKRIYYEFMKGETYYGQENYQKALIRYKKTISIALNTKQFSIDDKDSLQKTFDSVFKCLEFIEKQNNAAPNKDLLFTYRSYLKLFSTSSLASTVHQKLINLSFNTQSDAKTYAYLSNYIKLFPKQIKTQVVFFKRLINRAVKQKDTKKLTTYSKMLAANFLNLKKSELGRVNSMITKLYFEEIEKLESEGTFDLALNRYLEIFQDENVSRRLRKIAQQKRLALVDKTSPSSLMTELRSYYSFLTANEITSDKQRIEYYIQKICVSADYKSCLASINMYSKNNKSLSPLFISFYIDSLLLNNNIELASRLVTNSEKIIGSDITKSKNDLIINLISTLNSEERIKVSSNLSGTQALKKSLSLVNATINKNLFFETNKLETLRNLYSKKDYDYYKNAALKLTNLANFQPPTLPDTEVSFESFSKDLTDLSKNLNSFISEIDNYIKTFPTPLAHKAYYLAARKLEDAAFFLSNYFPLTNDKELQKAIENELANLSKIYLNQANAYKMLNFKLLKKINSSSGGNNYYYKLNRETLWQKELIQQQVL